MIRLGHTECMNYPISFFTDCLEEIAKNERTQVQNMALAVRGANTDNFNKFIKDIEG